LDVFLFALVALHVGILIGVFFGMKGAELPTVWLFLWVVIVVVAWITTWDPEPENAV